MALIIFDRNLGTAFFLKRRLFVHSLASNQEGAKALIRRENYTEVVKARKARDTHDHVFLGT
jgi:hypothetical protein